MMSETKYAIHHNAERLPLSFEFATLAVIHMILTGLKESDGYGWEPVT